MNCKKFIAIDVINEVRRLCFEDVLLAGIFFEKMRFHRVKKRSGRQMASLGQTLSFVSFAAVCGEMSSAGLSIGKRNLNGFSSDLRSKHLTDASSVLSGHTTELIDKSSLMFGFWTSADNS